MFRDGGYECELVPYNCRGVAVIRLKIIGQKTKFTKT